MIRGEWRKVQHSEENAVIHSRVKNVFSGSDGDVFEDPDEETLSGKLFIELPEEEMMSEEWFIMNKYTSLTFTQKDDGAIGGYRENKVDCWINGKVEGEDIVFFENYHDMSTRIRGAKELMQTLW